MVRIIRNPENNLIAVVATTVGGDERTIQYKSDNPFSTLPGPGNNPEIRKIIDLTGGFNIWGDGAQCVIKAYHLGFTSRTSRFSSTRLLDNPADLIKAFSEAGFSHPALVTPLPVRLMRQVAGWLGYGRPAP